MKPIHITEGNLLRSKSSYLNVNLIQNTCLQKHPEESLTKYLGTEAQPNRHIKLTTTHSMDALQFIHFTFRLFSYILFASINSDQNPFIPIGKNPRRKIIRSNGMLICNYNRYCGTISKRVFYVYNKLLGCFWHCWVISNQWMQKFNIFFLCQGGNVFQETFCKTETLKRFSFSGW